MPAFSPILNPALSICDCRYKRAVLQSAYCMALIGARPVSLDSAISFASNTYNRSMPAQLPSNATETHTNLGQGIPDIVIGRLPIYLRTLKMLIDRNQDVTSSQELGELLGISSAQIRKDLSHFGEFGKQGTGYNIPYLCKQLEKILKVDCVWPVVLVGAGNLGHALASYNGFEEHGFRIVGVFDNADVKVGEMLGANKVQSLTALSSFIASNQCQIAILAVPATAAQQVSDTLVEAGIRSILCYAPITLNVPTSVRVEYIDPIIHFQHMTFYLEKGCLDE